MKTWAEWHELWSALEAGVRAPCPPFTASQEWAQVVAKIEEREAATREAVNRACRRWAKEYEWPARMSGEVRWFVHLRVVHAVSASLLLLHPHRSAGAVVPVLAPAEGVTERMLNEWFLIGSWPCGWSALRAELRSGGGERPSRFEPGSS